MTQIDTSTETIEALLKDVTPGPWSFHRDELLGKNNRFVADVDQEFSEDYVEADANARFITASRELVPALLAERDALKAEVERLKAQIAVTSYTLMKEAVDEVWNEAIEAAAKYLSYQASVCTGKDDSDFINAIAQGVSLIKRPVEGESHE